MRSAGCTVRVVKVGLDRKIGFKQKHKGGERVSQLNVWGSTVQAERTVKAKA